MKKNSLILLLILAPAAFLMLLLANSFSSKRISNPFLSPTPFPTISTNYNADNLITLAPSASTNIEVLSPRSGDRVKPGFVVKGNARTFESVVSMRLLDSEGNLLIETNTLANAPDANFFGPFEKELTFQTEAETGTLEVFQYSAKDGSEIDKVTIPLFFN